MPKRPPSQPSSDSFENEPTPRPTDIEEQLERLWAIRKSADQLIALNTRIERLEKRPDTVLDELRELSEHVVDIKGVSGDNGKIGSLRAELARVEARLEKQEARRWTLITTAIGMILTAATLAVTGGRWLGKLENRVDQLERIQQESSHDRHP